MRQLSVGLTVVIGVLAWGQAAQAAPIDYSDLASFQSASGPLTSDGFTGLPNGTVVTTQFPGFELLDGDDTILNNPNTIDGTFVTGNGGMSILFPEPILAVGFDHSGTLRISLFDDLGGSLVYSSDFGSVGFFFFAGIVSDIPFRYVTLTRPTVDASFIDTINFGAAVPVPEPTTLLLLATGLGAVGYRRRRK